MLAAGVTLSELAGGRVAVGLLAAGVTILDLAGGRVAIRLLAAGVTLRFGWWKSSSKSVYWRCHTLIPIIFGFRERRGADDSLVDSS